MDTVVVMLFLLGSVAWIGVTLEITHRRNRGLSRMPSGVDLEGDRDMIRTLAEIEAVRSRSVDTTTTRATTGGAGRPVRPRRRDRWLHGGEPGRHAGARHTGME